VHGIRRERGQQKKRLGEGKGKKGEVLKPTVRKSGEITKTGAGGESELDNTKERIKKKKGGGISPYVWSEERRALDFEGSRDRTPSVTIENLGSYRIALKGEKKKRTGAAPVPARRHENRCTKNVLMRAQGRGEISRRINADDGAFIAMTT